jgi:hypothetical protein
MEMLTFAEHIHPRIVKLGVRDAGYAGRAREAVTEKFAKVFGQTQDIRAAHEGAMALLKDFEDHVDVYVAEQAHQRQAQLVASQQYAVAAARARALSNARDRPMRPAEILIAVERSGHRIRLRKGLIEVAPSSDLALELEMQIVEHNAVLSDYLQQRDDWRTVVAVTRNDGGEAEENA